MGSLHFLYLYLDDLARGRAHTLPMRLLEEGTGTLGAAVLVVGIVLLEQRWPITRQTWQRAAPIHVFGLLAFSVLHTSLNLVTRDILSPLIGLGPYNYGRLSIRYFMEFPNDTIIYAFVLTVAAGVRTWLSLRDREVNAAELERALAQEQLRNLQLQLQPHFLFNALNTISERMYDDPSAADAMMGQLAELLRHSLRAPIAHEVPLRDEVSLLANYIGIMRARFGEALSVEVDVDPTVASAAVPSLLLQPLVENAIRHGVGPRGGGRIEVQARRRADWLELAVRDDGVGATDASAIISGGIGLSTTRDRLQLFYGDAHTFEAGNRPGGGFAVMVRVPFREQGTALTGVRAVPLLRAPDSADGTFAPSHPQGIGGDSP
jgi:two-component system, LytTR family, sensor kinase